MINTAIVEGVVSIIELDKKRCKIDTDDLSIMVHYNTQIYHLGKGMKIRIVGKCFTGGVIAEHIEVMEKVFIPKHQEKEYNLQGSLFNFDEMM